MNLLALRYPVGPGRRQQGRAGVGFGERMRYSSQLRAGVSPQCGLRRWLRAKEQAWIAQLFI